MGTRLVYTSALQWEALDSFKLLLVVGYYSGTTDKGFSKERTPSHKCSLSTFLISISPWLVPKCPLLRSSIACLLLAPTLYLGCTVYSVDGAHYKLLYTATDVDEQTEPSEFFKREVKEYLDEQALLDLDPSRRATRQTTHGKGHPSRSHVFREHMCMGPS